ncbi:cytochrome P450 [Calocera viscosa TUFC12733]|uniref:Cytochrome P450 n=1 Tax=Calocera viscosa (strain TUFC12733) TaxID=1330018 RepID=A0A167QGJ4_CALVF|nr:cytochrome P450 [Calocera viscosa TUFC12733]
MLSLVGALVVLVLAVAGVHDVYRKRTSRLPPGPTGLPLLGNILQLPSQFLWYKLHAWSKQYGPIYTIWMMGTPIVILDGIKVAADVLDRMSGATSDRPYIIKGEFFRIENVIANMNRTLDWRGQRRSIHANLNIRATTRFNHVQAYDAAYLTLGLLQHPEKPFDEHVHRFAGSVIFRCAYGGEVFPLLGMDPSRYIEKLHKQLLHSMAPQNSIVDMLPFLKPLIQRVKWLRREADEWYESTDQEGNRLYDGAVPTEGWNTIVQDLNANMKKYGVTKHGAVWTTMTLYMAGQETTSTALRALALGILHNPDVMRAAQAQLDAVCGQRAPAFEDREKLPYIDALVKEIVRWKPGVPMGLLHAASEDFDYQGYVIPKGTNLIDNIWGQTRDTSVYQNPEEFDPTRFLDGSGNLLPVTPDTRLDLLGFGHGRRICPGKDFAVNGIFIACAYLLWAFRLEWPIDPQGKAVMCGVDEMEDHSFVATPRPFAFVLKPRQEGLEESLRAAMKE